MNNTPLVDDHLLSLRGMQEAGTDDFFYTRLRARMERKEPATAWRFPLKPVWVVGTLVLLLAINGFMLSQQFRSKQPSANAQSPSLQNFAQSYDQSLSTY